MTIRSRALSVLALLVTIVLAVAGCGGDDGGGGGDSKDAEALLKRAFAKQVDSAQLKIDVKADLEGVEQLDGPITLALSGPFKSQGKNKLPVLDWKVAAQGAGQKFDVGVTVTEDNAYVQFQGQAYELGSALFKRFSQQFAQQGSQSQSQSLKAFGVDPASWLRDAKVEDGDSIGGDSTRKISGDVDVRALVRDVLEALRSPALRRQLERQGQTVPTIPEVKDSDIDKIEEAIKDLEFEANVDENDIVRRLFVKAGFDVPEGADAGSLKGGEVSFAFVLEEVGIKPDIKAPANPQPLGGLLQQFGLGGGLSLPQQQ